MSLEELLQLDKYLARKDIVSNNIDYDKNEAIIKKHNDNFVGRKLIEYKDYFDNMYIGIDDNVILDLEQRIAILTNEDYNMVIAGAGAGKTTTIAAKVKYLVEILKVEPSKIILISYTNKAVLELKQRINKDFKIPVKVCTFHKFGVDILRKNTDEHLKILIDGYKIISDYFEQELCKDNETLKEFLKFFVFYFDIPTSALKFDSLDSYHQYKKRNDYITLKTRLEEYNKSVIDTRTKKQYTVLGEFLRSSEEVMIANFLYLNGIDYDYEKPYPKLDKSKTYLPDFTIYQGEKVFYLEHYGINQYGENKRYSKLANYKYNRQIGLKRKLHNDFNTILIETYSSYSDNRNLLEHLKEELISHGLVLNPKNDKEIYNKLVDTSKDIYYTRFIIFCINFIRGYKIKGYNELDFDKLKKENKDIRTLMFLNFIEKVYIYYERELAINHYIDFEDMINRSYNQLCLFEKDDSSLDYEYIIIDEYQDISIQRFNLAKKVSEVCKAKIIVVGDDWQAVFAFAGSDVSLFTDFEKLMGYATQLSITHTYRNSQELIDIAGKFIMQNNWQIKKSLKSPKRIDKPVKIIVYDDSNKKTYNKCNMIDNCLKDIFKRYGSKAKILLIGRYGFEKYQLFSSQLFYEKNAKIVSNNYPNFDIDFLTAHSSKGLGYDQVIIINGNDGTYGFPSQIKDDPIMEIVNVKDNSYLFAEERRLFYVALTRTKNEVYIITPCNHPSKFLLEIKDYKNVYIVNKTNHKLSSKADNCPKCGMPLVRKYKYYLNIPNLYVCTNEKEICDFKTNNLTFKQNIVDCPQCKKGKIVVKYSPKNNYYFLGCTNYKDGKGCTYTRKIF